MKKIIGLKRGSVDVVPYQHEWKQLYNEAETVISKQIGELSHVIQHVGSTAVPGLSAKPIIDIAIAVESKNTIPEISKRLEEIGYIDRGDGGQDGGYLFVKDIAPEVRTFHVHVVEINDPQWNNYLSFRDALRTSKELRDNYMSIKQEFKKQFGNNRKAYTSGKNKFITEVLSTTTKKSFR